MFEIEDAIRDFTAHQVGVKAAKLAMTSRLLQDLGVDGDDAVEFFQAFQRTFDVNLEKLRENWSVHFHPEGVGGSLPFQGLFDSRPFPGQEVPISIQDLIDAALAKRWVKVYRWEPAYPSE
jgi:acyl carrier protein